MGDIEANALNLREALEYGIWTTNGALAQILFAWNCRRNTRNGAFVVGWGLFCIGVSGFPKQFQTG